MSIASVLRQCLVGLKPDLPRTAVHRLSGGHRESYWLHRTNGRDCATEGSRAVFAATRRPADSGSGTDGDARSHPHTHDGAAIVGRVVVAKGRARVDTGVDTTNRRAPPAGRFRSRCTCSGFSYSFRHHSRTFPLMSTAPPGEAPCGYRPTAVVRLSRSPRYWHSQDAPPLPRETYWPDFPQ